MYIIDTLISSVLVTRPFLMKGKLHASSFKTNVTRIKSSDVIPLAESEFLLTIKECVLGHCLL